jgi:nucleoside-diphosphate-sugar epimerase
MKKTVVTGAAGFIGEALISFLCRQSCEVIAVDLKPFSSPAARNTTADLCEPDSLAGVFDRDTIVFHLAGSANVTGSVENPSNDFRQNLVAAFQVLETARKTGATIVMPSTASVYDPDGPQPLTERSPVRPVSPYGAAKAAVEAYCVAYHKTYGVDVRIARIFSVYGEGMRRFAICDIVRKILKNRRELLLRGDGQQVRDYIYIQDVVQALHAIATAGCPGEAYNVAGANPVRLLDLASRVAELMGVHDLRIVTDQTPVPGDIPILTADISKLRSIGFAPKMDLDTGLRRTIEWLTSAESTKALG